MQLYAYLEDLGERSSRELGLSLCLDENPADNGADYHKLLQFKDNGNLEDLERRSILAITPQERATSSLHLLWILYLHQGDIDLAEGVFSTYLGAVKTRLSKLKEATISSKLPSLNVKFYSWFLLQTLDLFKVTPSSLYSQLSAFLLHWYTEKSF